MAFKTGTAKILLFRKMQTLATKYYICMLNSLQDGKETLHPYTSYGGTPSC